MPDQLEYIVDKAVCHCDKGAAPNFFKGLANQNVKINGCMACTKADKIPMANVPSFGLCSVTGSACVPAPVDWTDTYKVKIKGKETLLFKSKLPCGLGGKIEFLTSGQIPITQEDLEKMIDENSEEKEKEDEGWGWWDTAELIPVVGSIIGIVRESAKGNFWMAAANVGFLAMDIAGVVSFGATTAASTALKTGAKVGVKAAAKASLKAAGKASLEVAGKILTKSGAKALAKGIAKHVDDIARAAGDKLCVFACFTGDTLVHVKNGLKEIKDIQLNDEVYSYDIDTNSVNLRKVIGLFNDDVEEILKITTHKGVILTTKNHPFYVNGEYKDAEQIEVGDRLFSIKGGDSQVISTEISFRKVKVYTFEVEIDECYFVGENGYLVHNACYHTTFFGAYPWLRGKVVVHHAIEQQVLKRYPGIFTKAEIHALENLRGIPKKINNDLHLSKIRKEWNKFYKRFDQAGIVPSKKQLEDYARAIDKKFSNQFDPPFSVWPR